MIESSEKDLRRLKGRQAELLAIKRCLLSADGLIFRDYLIRTFCITTTFDDNSARASFKEGQRSLALQIVGTAYKQDIFSKQINDLLANIEQQQTEE